MILEKCGLSVRIVDSDNNKIPEYQVEETDDNTIQCWIPSTEGNNFGIQVEIVENLHPEYDLRTVPFLDGVRMRGLVTPKQKLNEGHITHHYMEPTGESTARLYEFGKRILTDNDNCTKPDKLILDNLNTIKLVCRWGYRGVTKPRMIFDVPPEIGPIHEKSVKKGHSGAAKLGKKVSISDALQSVAFNNSEKINPVTFSFCYAPENWLRARDIIPRSPEPELQEIKSMKRERNDTPEIVDIDELETDDDEIQIIRHMVPAPVAANKRQRVSEQGTVTNTKKEED